MDRRRFLTATAALAGAAAVLPATPAAARIASAPGAAPGDRLPPRREIVAVLRRVADQWIGAHGDPGDNQWARATFFSGLMALHGLTKEPRYLAYARGWAEKHGYALNGGVTTRHADNHCAGQAYLDLYEAEAEPDDAKIAAIEESLNRMVHTDRPEKNDDWWWDDALHMAMPPLARLGALRGDPAFATKMHALYTHTKGAEGGPGLYVPARGLWYRDKNFLPGAITSPAGLPVLWSRGNGWVAGAHAKVLAALPGGHPDVPEYRRTLVAELAALRDVQRADGFWNVNLADPAHLPGPETSGTAFFAYATAYAVRARLVPAATYGPVAARAWNGMVATAVHADGFLGYVQGVGDRPESSQPVNRDTTADFGVGAFLRAGTELAALAGTTG
ncbi:glycosyl hydrolase family 88 [Streptomyces tsukubensis]|uniref:Glycosyl hydrolase family 88 n=1 Tax=Streptomyces tsukubensis TaxID=83656 RepID=A0A1V4A961_9ACTN|nr:glycosyl hydrolase family 88 [Streptomyces tsukubensis]QFR97790.1 glycosyl hydrolase family 88 [Streptomyces tsukubensis]